jgi:hypothetical protein
MTSYALLACVLMGVIHMKQECNTNAYLKLYYFGSFFATFKINFEQHSDSSDTTRFTTFSWTSSIHSQSKSTIVHKKMRKEGYL